MKKSKTQKGITLIALIITIVVLLILAVVTIGAVQNDGIIEHAKNARKEYETAQTNEQTALGNYLDKIEENIPKGENGEGDTEQVVSLTGTWTQNKRVLTNEKGETINVGDYVDYKVGCITGYEPGEDENGEMIEVPIYGYYIDKWRVLGAENGEILLMSLTNSDTSWGELVGEYTSTDRFVETDDINRIIGYNPETEKYGEGTITEYGNKVSYSFSSRTVGDEEAGYWEENVLNYTVEGKPELNGSSGVSYSSFVDPMKEYYLNTFYTYDVTKYFPDTINDPIYVMLFRNVDNTDYVSYALWDYYTIAGEHGWEDGMRYVINGNISHSQTYTGEAGDQGAGMGSYGVRSVISLGTDTVLTWNSTTNSWNLSK